MARLKLNAGMSLKQLGYAILDAAAAKADNATDRIVAAEERILGMFSNDKSVRIYFHYDEPDRVHVVIPDLQGKRFPARQSSLQDFEISDIAAECMASVVIRGGGK